MASEFSDEFEGDALPDLATTFGRSVSLYRNAEGTPLAVSALIEWQPSSEDKTNGRSSRQIGTVKLVPSTGLVFDRVTTADRLKIGDHFYAVTAVSEPESGKLPLSVARTTKDMQTGSRGVI